ncbi:hypothetical protein CALCODRAFT_480230 [Calocera cornea HHB12733]|uniref:Uncharacterized protein n=1 Tax=Calocera cornea HHB12733 TaxID=1353952 RepID=A0A165IWG3_9BASI|nr:hypothetical protein CALCODRAFT_480230 [Calocera cornea HHB12733]
MPTSHLEDPLYTIAENAKEAAAQLRIKVAAIRARYEEEELRRKYRMFGSSSDSMPTSREESEELGSPRQDGRATSPHHDLFSPASEDFDDEDQEDEVEMVEVDELEEEDGVEDPDDSSIVAYSENGDGYPIQDGAVMVDEERYEEECEEEEAGEELEEVEEMEEQEEEDYVDEGYEEEEEPEYGVNGEEDKDMEDGDEEDADAHTPPTVQRTQAADDDIDEDADPTPAGAPITSYVIPESIDMTQSSSQFDDQPYTHISPNSFGPFPLNNDLLALPTESGPSWLSAFMDATPVNGLQEAFLANTPGLYETEHPYEQVHEEFSHLPAAASLAGLPADSALSLGLFGGFDAFVDFSPIVESQPQFPSVLSLPSNPLDVLAAAASWNIVADGSIVPVEEDGQQSTMSSMEQHDLIPGPTNVSSLVAPGPNITIEVETVMPMDDVATTVPDAIMLDSNAALPSAGSDLNADRSSVPSELPNPPFIDPITPSCASTAESEDNANQSVPVSTRKEPDAEAPHITVAEGSATSPETVPYDIVVTTEDMPLYVPDVELSSEFPTTAASMSLPDDEGTASLAPSLDPASQALVEPVVDNLDAVEKKAESVEPFSSSADATSRLPSTSELPLAMAHSATDEMETTSIVNDEDAVIPPSHVETPVGATEEASDDMALHDPTAAGIEDETMVEAMLSMLTETALSQDSMDEGTEEEDIEEISGMLLMVEEIIEDSEQSEDIALFTSRSEGSRDVPQIRTVQVTLASNEYSSVAHLEEDERDDISVVSRMIPTNESREPTPVPNDIVRLFDSRAATPLSPAPSDLFSGDYDLEEFHPELEQRDAQDRNPLEGLALPLRQGLHLLEQSFPPRQPDVDNGVKEQIQVAFAVENASTAVTQMAKEASLSASDGAASDPDAELQTIVEDGGSNIRDSETSNDEGSMSNSTGRDKTSTLVDVESMDAETKAPITHLGISKSHVQLREEDSDKVVSPSGESLGKQSGMRVVPRIKAEESFERKDSPENTDTISDHPAALLVPLETPRITAPEAQDEEQLSDTGFEFTKLCSS